MRAIIESFEDRNIVLLNAALVARAPQDDGVATSGVAVTRPGPTFTPTAPKVRRATCRASCITKGVRTCSASDAMLCVCVCVCVCVCCGVAWVQILVKGEPRVALFRIERAATAPADVSLFKGARGAARAAVLTVGRLCNAHGTERTGGPGRRHGWTPCQCFQAAGCSRSPMALWCVRWCVCG